MLTEVQVVTPMMMVDSTVNTAILDAFLFSEGCFFMTSLWRWAGARHCRKRVCETGLEVVRLQLGGKIDRPYRWRDAL